MILAVLAAHHGHHATPSPVPSANWSIAHGAFVLTWHEQSFLVILLISAVIMLIARARKRHRNARQRQAPRQPSYRY